MSMRLSNLLKVICIGANWMHPIKRESGIEPERLWSFLVFCYDGIPLYMLLFRITANIKQTLLSRSTKIQDSSVWTRNISKRFASTR